MIGGKAPRVSHARLGRTRKMCSCGALVDAMTSYFGVPLHQYGDPASRYVVCPRWSGL